METFAKGAPNLHFFFRNRLSQCYSIMQNKNIDGLLILTCNIII